MHQPVRPANRRKYGSNRERPHSATHRETTTNSAARNNSRASAGPKPIGLGSGKSALSRFDNIEAYILSACPLAHARGYNAGPGLHGVGNAGDVAPRQHGDSAHLK